MHWGGKFVGALVGSLVAGPVGTAVGLLVGHQYDRGRATPEDWRGIGELFFAATFTAMGHVAKADGRVSEAEIAAARGIMSRMHLNAGQVQEAIRLFGAGKAQDYDLERTITRLARASRHRRSLRRAFLEIQMEAVLAAGSPAPAVRAALWRIAAGLDISRVEMVQIEALLRLARTARGAAAAASPPSAGDAYRVLGLEPSASNEDVKLAYRRLMNQHHPDKLRARGMPESMLPVAEEKTVRIRAAWDAIRSVRGL